MGNKSYLFILESPSPFELARGIFEGDILKDISKLLKIPTYHSIIKNKENLIQEIGFIESSGDYLSNSDNHPSIILHLSCHGNEDGLAIGQDNISWENLFEITKSFFDSFTSFGGNRYLTLSACNSEQQRLTQFLGKSDLINTPEFIFTCQGQPLWDESGLQWAAFYSKLVKLNLKNNSGKLKNDVQDIIGKINNSIFPGITYFRKDEAGKYKKYTG